MTCTSTGVAIIHLANKFKCIHALRKNINTVAMLTHDALLRPFRKGMYGMCHNKVSDQRPCAQIRKWAFENTGTGVGKNRNGRLTETCTGVTGTGTDRTVATLPMARMLAHTCEWHLRANIDNTYGGANLSNADYNRVFQTTRAFNSNQLERSQSPSSIRQELPYANFVNRVTLFRQTSAHGPDLTHPSILHDVIVYNREEDSPAHSSFCNGTVVNKDSLLDII